MLTEPVRTRLDISVLSAPLRPLRNEADADNNTDTPKMLCRSQCKPSTTDDTWLSKSEHSHSY